jgi:hypothetical protein
MNSYELSRNFTDWCFDNPHKVKPIHYAIFYFSIEHCNRLGWKENFGFPSQMVMEAIGVKNWRTYSAGLNELAEFGFIRIIEKSQNQYSSNIIAIVNFTKAHTKPLDKALSNHHTNHSQTTVSIDKQDNNKQIDNVILFNYKKCSDKELVEELSKFKETYSKDILNSFYRYWSEKDDKGKTKMSLEKTFEVDKRLITWSSNDKKFNKVENKIAEKNIIW